MEYSFFGGGGCGGGCLPAASIKFPFFTWRAGLGWAGLGWAAGLAGRRRSVRDVKNNYYYCGATRVRRGGGGG